MLFPSLFGGQMWGIDGGYPAADSGKERAVAAGIFDSYFSGGFEYSVNSALIFQTVPDGDLGSP